MITHWAVMRANNNASALITNFRQDRKADQKCYKTLKALCILWLPWKAPTIPGAVGVTNNGKN